MLTETNQGNMNREELINSAIAEMSADPDSRLELIRILNKNGVGISAEASDRELFTSIYTAIPYSSAFKNDLKKSMYFYLKENLPTEEEFSNVLADANPFSISGTGQGKTTGGTTGSKFKKIGTGKPVKKSTTRKKFGETAVGSFFGNLFSQENVASAVNYGVNIVGSKLGEKATREQVKQGIEYQVAETERAKKQAELEQQRSKWIIPVAIVGGVVVIAVVGYLIYKSKKSK